MLNLDSLWKIALASLAIMIVAGALGVLTEWVFFAAIWISNKIRNRTLNDITFFVLLAAVIFVWVFIWLTAYQHGR